jgi:hypothetical protein
VTEITLLPEFAEAIRGLREPEPWTLPIRPNAACLSEQIRLIEEIDQGEALLAQLNRLPIAAMAIDTEFQFASDPVDLGRGRSWQDPTTLQPLILSGAAWIADSDTVISFAFDLRRRELVPLIERLLRLRVMFVAHFFNAEFKTLWSLGIEPVLPELYDTWVAARALTLGRGHRSIDLLAEARADEDFTAAQEAGEMLVGHLSLIGQCAIYGIEHRFAAAKDLLRGSFLAQRPDQPFSSLQIEYAAADAEATMRLYLAQQRDVIAAGLYPHLMQVEFAYAEANARMEWEGVPVSPERLTQLLGVSVARSISTAGC